MTNTDGSQAASPNFAALVNKAIVLRHLAQTSSDDHIKDGAGRLADALVAMANGATDQLPDDDNTTAALRALAKR